MSEFKGTRRIIRRELKTTVLIRLHESSKKDVGLLEDYIKAETSDLGESGLGIITSVYLPEGTCLEIELDSSSLGSGEKGSVHIVGRVSSSIMGEGGYRIGIQFLEISERDKAIIKNYIQ